MTKYAQGILNRFLEAELSYEDAQQAIIYLFNLIVFSFVFLSSYHKFVDYINFPTSENCTISMVTYHSGTKDEEGQKYLSQIQSEQVLNFLTSFKFKGFVPGINLSSSEIMYQLTIEAEVPSYTAVFYLPKTMDKIFILDYPLIVATRGK